MELSRLQVQLQCVVWHYLPEDQAPLAGVVSCYLTGAERQEEHIVSPTGPRP